MIEYDAAEAITFVELMTGLAWEITGISIEDPIWVSCANVAIQVISLDASDACNCQGKGGAGRGDVDADSLEEKLTTVACQILDT